MHSLNIVYDLKVELMGHIVKSLGGGTIARRSDMSHPPSPVSYIWSLLMTIVDCVLHLIKIIKLDWHLKHKDLYLTIYL